MVRSLLLAALPFVAAWPGVMEMNERLQQREEPEPRSPTFLSGRPNTGSGGPALDFNAAEQLVSVAPGSGHEFKSPGSGDIRGQCPGLNAAANHGYLPHNGLLTIQDTVQGLHNAYGMSADLAAFLSVVSIAVSGDVVGGKWSIGGAFPSALPLLGGAPKGIAGTHNQYESDASIVRGDAYLNGGNVGVFQMRSWEHLWNLGENGYNLDVVAAQSDYVTRWSKANNPYFFQAPFAGLVAPAAHDFVINFMSNHSAEQPSGYLNREILKTFFAVTGDSPGNFVHNRGQEKIPDNWYRRPNSRQYSIAETVADVLVNNAMYPGIVGVGGNTGTVNSYVGVDTGDLTGGAFNFASLGEGNNAACFFLQASQAGLPSATDPLLGQIGSIAAWAAQQLGPIAQDLGCPQLASFDNALFSKFPGASYQGSGQAKK